MNDHEDRFRLRGEGFDVWGSAHAINTGAGAENAVGGRIIRVHIHRIGDDVLAGRGEPDIEYFHALDCERHVSIEPLCGEENSMYLAIKRSEKEIHFEDTLIRDSSQRRTSKLTETSTTGTAGNSLFSWISRSYKTTEFLRSALPAGRFAGPADCGVAVQPQQLTEAARNQAGV